MHLNRTLCTSQDFLTITNVYCVTQKHTYPLEYILSKFRGRTYSLLGKWGVKKSYKIQKSIFSVNKNSFLGNKYNIGFVSLLLGE